MRLLLIRHGETVDNVAGIYAGTTNSALTNHGVLQATRLGSYLAESGLRIPYIFSSDLQRAFKTAEAVRVAQRDAPQITPLQILREQDFGSYEGKHFHERPKGTDNTGNEVQREVHSDSEGFRDVESKLSMNARVGVFLDDYLIPLLPFVADDETVVVVAHGIILMHLWRGILARFPPASVGVAASVASSRVEMGLEYLGGWSNTGYLDLEITSKVGHPSLRPPNPESVSSKQYLNSEPGGSVSIPESMPSSSSSSSFIHFENTTSAPTFAQRSNSTLPVGSAFKGRGEGPAASANPALPSKLLQMALLVKAVNSQEHLSGLKKTRGGIGSSKHDEKQQTVDSFFKRQKPG